MDEAVIIDHFKKRAKRYERYGKWVSDEEILRLMSSLVSNIPHNVLDVGAGTGAIVKYFIQKFPNSNFVALDNCNSMLLHIDESENIVRCLSSVTNIPYNDNTFDLVVSRQCLHYVKNLDKAFSEIYRVLQNGKTFILAEIIAADEESKEYWREAGRIRQPLRANSLSMEDWIAYTARFGLQEIQTLRYTSTVSIKNWSAAYRDNPEICTSDFISFLLNSPAEYKEKYHIRQVGEDINYDANWMIAKFIKC